MVGTSVGPYRLRSVLGEGGFGVVYLAEQVEPVRRRVAIKIIKPGMDSRAVLARFKAEEQALALMSHPGVARVFDGGETERRLPYFVMELVEGDPITDFCDRNRLTLAQRIELFARVCEAVQHAHTKGVIHRDLKPSNILVSYDHTGRASPKIIDFGVAKALNQSLTDATLLTVQGQLIGTPEYMSPEQAEMGATGIDTRADVYSLGVLLYELLTGFRPFDLRRSALSEVQRLIRETEPPKPSTRLSTLVGSSRDPETATRIARARRAEFRALPKKIRGDLDWVVMRCLEKDRERRYDTANALAMELKRYLHNEPVLAGPPSASYRIRKFVGRHRVGVAAAAAITVVLCAGVVATSVGWSRALAAERLAAGRLIETQELRENERNLTRQLEEELELANDALVEAEVERDRALAAERMVAVQQNEASEHFERYIGMERSMRALANTALSIEQRLTNADPRRLGELVEWLEGNREFIMSRGRADPEGALAIDLAVARIQLRLRRPERAVEVATEALIRLDRERVIALSKSNRGIDGVDTIDRECLKIVSEFATHEQYVECVRARLRARRDSGRAPAGYCLLASAELGHRSASDAGAIDEMLRLFEETADDPAASESVVATLDANIAAALLRAGRIGDAERRARARLAATLASDEAADGRIASDYATLGTVLLAAGEYRRAADAFRESLSASERAGWTNLSLAGAESRLALALVGAGEVETAARLARAAIDRVAAVGFDGGRTAASAAVALAVAGGSADAAEAIAALRGFEGPRSVHALAAESILAAASP